MSRQGISLPAGIRQQYELIVLRMLINGYSRNEIIQYTKGGVKPDGSVVEPWGVSDTTVDRYIRKAKDKLAEEAAIELQSEIGLALTQYNMLYHKAIQENDTRTALLVVKSKAELLGLNAPRRVESKNTGDITIVFDEKYDGIL